MLLVYSMGKDLQELSNFTIHSMACTSMLSAFFFKSKLALKAGRPEGHLAT